MDLKNDPILFLELLGIEVKDYQKEILLTLTTKETRVRETVIVRRTRTKFASLVNFEKYHSTIQVK